MAEPSPHAKGVYKGTIKGQRFGATPQKKTKYFEVDFVINHKQTPEGTLETLSAPIYRSVSIFLTSATIEKAGALEKIRALGAKADSFAKLDTQHPEFEDLAGNAVMLYHGAKDKYDWDIFTGGGRKKAESKPEVAQDLDDLFGDMLAQSNLAVSVAAPATGEKPTEAAVEAPTESVAEPVAEDEYPF